jgi:hypothetical protein
MTGRGICLGVLLCLLLLSSMMYSQQVSSVTGVVLDSTGAAIPGADVKLTDTQTGFTQSTKTNQSGVYLFVSVKPGSGYLLSFNAEGFKTLMITDVTLGVGVTETRNATLEVGAISISVVVEATGEGTLNTTDASIGNVIGTRSLVDLPVAIRNSPAALMSLQPGVVGDNIGTTAINRVGSVTGARADQGNITIDGIDANDQATGQAFSTVGNAPIDSIQEFRSVSANPAANEGRSSGAQIELVTKSGTNQFHGSLREFHRDKSTAANSFFNNKSGIPQAQLIRNQFGGSIGGPVVKDKLFFFFDYEGRRDASGVSYARTVPLVHVLDGSVAYINNNPGCTASSRLDTTPDCITILSAADVAAIDPNGIGANAALTAFLKDRYPEATDLSGGDGVNTGLLRFNIPSHRSDNTYTTRIDWMPASTHQVFGRFNIARQIQTDTVNPGRAPQFPGDPETGQIQAKDYSFALGETWNISATKLNQVTVGVSRSGLEFPVLFQPSFPNMWTFGPLADPYADISYQNRYVPVPTLRDEFTWIHGNHNTQFGGVIKPIRQNSTLIRDFNFVTLGLGGVTSALDDTLRPSDILSDVNDVAIGQWDSMFTFLLGRFARINTNFNYSVDGQAFPPGTGKKRSFHYNEFEFYAQDSWKVRSDLTVVYGLRWAYYGVPFEANGFEAINDVDIGNLFNIRQANAAAGVSGVNAEPFLRYDLGGKANDARGYSEPDLNNFAPRLSLAYNPAFKSGIMKKLFGDRKTVFRLGGAVVYDRVGGAITFIQDQGSYLFDNSVNTPFGNVSPTTALQTDPRFTAIGTLPLDNVAPTITRPFTPYVESGYPFGNAVGQFNYAVAQNFRTPYAITYNFGIQRELPGNFLFDMSFVGRQGRKLFTQGDASQALNFKDPESGQMLFDAFNFLQGEIQAGTPIFETLDQPWFENQMGSALGIPCSDYYGVSCTLLLRLAGFDSLVNRGDLSDTLQALYYFGLLNPNVGLSGQFSTNLFMTNNGSSSYNGMLFTLRKRYSRNLQFDFNYTFSHSIDNQSSIANTVYGGQVCDLTNLRTCRGNSDFDITHIINVNWIYDLPVGRGQKFLPDLPNWLNHVIGGWEVSGIYAWRSGLPFSTTTDSFPVGFYYNSPAVLIGDASALEENVHVDGDSIQYFADPSTALDALRNPHGGEIGNRNILRGPGFWNVDIAVLKNFKMPWSEGHRLQFRWESFNAFNHNSFGLPAANIRSSTFGRITSSASNPRQMQFALRYDF